MQLFDRDGQTQSELLDSVGLDHSTVSKSLRRMQEAGLVTRQPNEDDRRALNVWLTDRGQAMREPIEAMWATLEEMSTRDLDEVTINSFVATAHTIENSITSRRSIHQRPPEQPPQPTPRTDPNSLVSEIEL